MSLTGRITFGDVLIWEPNKPDAYCLVTVVPAPMGCLRHKVYLQDISGRVYGNDESRVREACDRVTLEQTADTKQVLATQIAHIAGSPDSASHNYPQYAESLRKKLNQIAAFAEELLREIRSVPSEQPRPYGKGPAVEPVLLTYVRNPNIFIGGVETFEALRNKLLACAVFIERERYHVEHPNDLPLSYQEVLERIATKIEERTAIGVKKYGESLHCDNGRDAVLDLSQEILDALQYCTQEIMQK